MSAIEPEVETLSQRELRNESGRVLREVSEGRSFVVTNSGVPVGKLIPFGGPNPTLAITRPARRQGGWTDLSIERKHADRTVSEMLDELRADRP
ncbi:type II toxin-antitoxin system prevent-host-death family antitoxin [Propionimicrobium sp. PCR01-08-3]|uniref:type II toxin-antitoxin system Phd/YefM family antitoxin n=1 Tax=Propionimicrobium sp. PCR01-08-3 TaxID=3052086 RepID=UPI00255CBBA4|nr:type II toxin-antitoxin system prevent-host-death family antitoxin [Propionimicrobium sp. PCR01-08-3]WIY83985.1 type II toxin-antitoxin system prevent-host-death family antitoxin [Propionimicrobium sp. PCR01-08-3]